MSKSHDINDYMQTEEKEFFQQKAEKIKKENKMKGCLFFVLILVGAFFLLKNYNIGNFQSNFNLKKSNHSSKAKKHVAIQNKELHKVPENIELIPLENEEEIDEENLIVLNVENEGRANPFTPYKEKSLYIMNNINENLLKGLPSPEENLEVDESAKKLYELRISGLLYDKNKSSAIVNIENQDYLVHKGDELFGFQIIDIRKDNVEVSYGTNSYELRIGEILTEAVNQNNIYNINNKFGGKKLPELENIQFLAEEE